VKLLTVIHLSYLGTVLFVLHAMDKPNSAEIRQATRSQHLEHLAKFETPVAGPLLDTHGNMTGSCIFLEAQDVAAAQEFSETDPYTLAGLFESVTIREFKKVIWP